MFLQWHGKKKYHTYTRTNTHAFASFQQESTWKQNPEAVWCLSLCLPWTFFFYGWRAHWDSGRGRESGRRGMTERVWKCFWLVKCSHWSLLGSLLALAVRALWAGEGKRQWAAACLKRAALRAPSCCDDRPRSGWKRRGVGEGRLWKNVIICENKLKYTFEAKSLPLVINMHK